ncbi:MAG: hypothetical protein DI535_21205 [Citrobacter freundii]|nr:MAG: hypothetical protein DI535_21205 [Citrobacter freundii]
MISDTSIIVLTPIKNEDWILDRFLSITSRFADHIILLDQSDGDEAMHTSKKYPKAIYIRNESNEYDEEYRQKILIAKARELVAGKKLLIAIDVDEIITAESINSSEWETICSQAQGTRIFFSKPDILPSLEEYINYEEPFLLGFVDDGRPHNGTKFHSPRLPFSEQRYFSQSIIFMHFALVRNKEYQARQRLYSVMENVKQTSQTRFRLRKYARHMQKLRNRNKTYEMPAGWLKPYKETGLDIEHFSSSEDNSYNRQVLAIFNDHPSRKFWMDDIWYVDYDEINRELGGICKRQIHKPSPVHDLARNLFIRGYAALLIATGKIN